MQTKSKQDKTNQKVDKITERIDTTLKVTPKHEDSFEEYTPKELEYLDRYKLLTGDLMEDEDIYDIILKYNFDDKRIKDEINEALKLLKNKGEEYGWTKIEHGKSKLFF